LERAEAAIGPAHAQDLITVLSDAEATETAAELIDLYAPNVAVSGDSLSLPIGTRFRLTFVAIGTPLVRDPEGCVDWCAVRRLKMTDISQC
jgi:hypothetical protein